MAAVVLLLLEDPGGDFAAAVGEGDLVELVLDDRGGLGGADDGRGGGGGVRGGRGRGGCGGGFGSGTLGS